MASPGEFQNNPTIATGDFQISKDGAAFANITAPVVTPSSTKSVKVTLTNTEMNADNILLLGIDQTAPKEWADFAMSIPTTTA